MDGKAHDFLFGPSTTGSEIAQYVFENWPEHWNEGETQKPDRPEVLRFIYRGRFLHASTTLECNVTMALSFHNSCVYYSPYIDISLPLGKTSTLHMIVRERIPNENQMGM